MDQGSLIKLDIIQMPGFTWEKGRNNSYKLASDILILMLWCVQLHMCMQACAHTYTISKHSTYNKEELMY